MCVLGKSEIRIYILWQENRIALRRRKEFVIVRCVFANLEHVRMISLFRILDSEILGEVSGVTDYCKTSSRFGSTCSEQLYSQTIS